MPGIPATAYFTGHFNDEFVQQEKVILFGFAFIALFLMGAGRFSLDAYLGKNIEL